MIRSLFFLTILALLAWVSVRIADHPGQIVVQWSEYTATLSVGQAFLFLTLFGIAFSITVRVLGLLLRSLRLARKHTERRNLRRGIDAAGQGFVALAAGNATAAARQARRARRYTPQHPLSLLLSAQTAQMQGQDQEAATYFRKMLARDDMAFVGATGLWAQACQQDDPQAALEHAGKAYSLNPHSERAARAYIEALMQAGSWREAQIIAFRAQNDRVLDKPAAERLRQAALIMRSRTTADPVAALDFAFEAFRIDHAYVPARIAYAEQLLVTQPAKARSLIEKGWLSQQAVPLLRAWEQSFSHTLPQAERLAKAAPDLPAVRLMLAHVLSTAGKLSEARGLLLMLAHESPSAPVYDLLAEVTRRAPGEGALMDGVQVDGAQADDWLDKAASAPDLPDWTCTACGNTEPVWQPLCTSCRGVLTLTTTGRGEGISHHPVKSPGD
jgi:HemY protein